jgi:diadenosine tetraphosphate (Ap4A) HIT family hydrolase
VPRQAGAAELTELSAEARAMLMEEIAAASTAVAELPGVEKINVGALGNIVRQLHVHVIGRNMTDAAWPGPVWGSGGAVRHAPDRARALVEQLRRLLIDQRR